SAARQKYQKPHTVLEEGLSVERRINHRQYVE
ncbi:hypothetical protein OKW31_003370, partial [Paraburkholderia atlantica]